MPRPCTICQHLDVSAIDLAILSGEAVVPIGRRFGLSKSAVHRHKLQCLRAAAPSAQASRIPRDDIFKAEMASVNAGGAGGVGGRPAADGADQGQAARAARLAPGASAAAPTLQDLVAILARSVKRLDDAAEKAVSGGNGAALAAASGQLHKGVELLSRLVGAHGPADDRAAPQINIILGSPPASVPAVEGMRVIDEEGRAQDGAAFTMRLTASGAAPAAVPPSLAKPQEAAIAPAPAAASLSPAVPSAQQSGESAPAFVRDLKMPEFQL